MIDAEYWLARQEGLTARRKRAVERLKAPVRVQEVIRSAARQCNVSTAAVTSTTRLSNAVAARVAAATELHAMGISTTLIGRYLGGRHHSSVLHYLSKSAAVTPSTGDIDPQICDEWI
jgi:chromosomal replication initiation ATPase DnaA